MCQSYIAFRAREEEKCWLWILRASECERLSGFLLLRLRADQREGKQERDEKALCEKKVEETDDDDGLVGITQR